MIKFLIWSFFFSGSTPPTPGKKHVWSGFAALQDVRVTSPHGKVWILGFTLWIPTSRYRISYSLIFRWNVISRSYRKRNSGFLELCFRLESTRLHFRSKNFQDHLTLGKVDVTCIWDDVSETQRCNIVSNSYNVVPRLQDCVELKIVDANRPV